MDETNYEPTPAEIAAACKRIRSKWAPNEHDRRLVGPADGSTLIGHVRGRERRWVPPVIEVPDDVAYLVGT